MTRILEKIRKLCFFGGLFFLSCQCFPDTVFADSCATAEWSSGGYSYWRQTNTCKSWTDGNECNGTSTPAGYSCETRVLGDNNTWCNFTCGAWAFNCCVRCCKKCTKSCKSQTGTACGVSRDDGCKTGCGTGTYCATSGYVCTSGKCVCNDQCKSAATTACGASLNNGCKTDCGAGTYCANGAVCTGGACSSGYTEVMKVQCPGVTIPVRIAGSKTSTSPLKIQKSDGVYGVEYVPVGDANGSCVHIKLPTLGEKVLRKCNPAVTATCA